MRFNSRNLLLALALGAFTLTASSSWAGTMSAAGFQATPGSQPTPGAQPTPGSQPMQPSPGDQSQTKVQSISGTIVKSGGQYTLQASDGQEYQLSGASQAKSYVGKSVTVTGSVDSSSHSIDVQSIQPQ